MSSHEFELLTASLPHREEVVIEVFKRRDDGRREQFAELRFENRSEGPRIQIFEREDGEPWDFDLFAFHRVMDEAWERFRVTFEPELSVMPQQQEPQPEPDRDQ